MQRHRLPALLLGGTSLLLALAPVRLWERLPPLCLNRHVWGWCPGCGTVRGLAHLAHGDVAAALKLNPLTLLTGPLLAGLAVYHGFRWLRSRRRGPLP